MLAELLFLTLEGTQSRTVIGMVQPNSTRFQAIIIYPDLKDPEIKCLGFYDSSEIARRVVETEARATWRELCGADDVEQSCVVREYEREAVSA